MKNLIKIFTLLILNLGILVNNAFSQEKNLPSLREKTEFNVPVKKRDPILKTLKEVMETRKKMREIERQTIENDPELKTDFEKLIELKRQMRLKLEEKLKDNIEYQNLKKKLKEIEERIKENIKRKEVEK
ncbi:MAG: hypothetical protein NC926_00465 [Candidatus Omnitrophica bacterium]|nr:hypothetical protein [Candidatus Omnitrophota bacterium]MCM8806423.1 hypothetical protein [Candidatus Omnitrophota bacterium]